MTTGRLADVGLTLGARSGQGLSIRRDDASLESLIDDNATLSAHLDQSQAALTAMASTADDFLQSLLALPAGSAAPLQQQAATGLAAFIDTANTASGGHFLFAGINTANQPMKDYATGGKPAVDAAFLAAFGVTQSDPAVASITSAQMSTFLDTQFAALFADPAWGTDWSTAANQNLTQRISPNEKVATSVNANDTAMRKLAMAYTMVADLGTTSLSADARNVLLAKATTIIGGAVTDLTTLQGQLGDVKKRVDDASERMKQNRDLLATQLHALEGVDPAEAKVRSDSFSAELEMSYSLTNKLLHLSILNYA